MIGSDDVAVTGLSTDGREVPVLRGGTELTAPPVLPAVPTGTRVSLATRAPFVHGALFGAAATRSARGRAPRRTSCGSPRSANGTSITSKSRGTTVAGKHLARLARELAAEVARRDVRQREQAHAGVARELGRLQRGRVQRVGGAVALLLGERRLVDEHVGALGEHAHRLDRRGVARDDDAPARPRLRRAPRPA